MTHNDDVTGRARREASDQSAAKADGPEAKARREAPRRPTTRHRHLSSAQHACSRCSAVFCGDHTAAWTLVAPPSSRTSVSCATEDHQADARRLAHPHPQISPSRGTSMRRAQGQTAAGTDLAGVLQRQPSAILPQHSSGCGPSTPAARAECQPCPRSRSRREYQHRRRPSLSTRWGRAQHRRTASRSAHRHRRWFPLPGHVFLNAEPIRRF